MKYADKKDIYKKEKIIVISILAIILLIILILVLIKMDVFSGFAIFNSDEPEEKKIYQVYQQQCSKEEAYFEELAVLVGGSQKKLREIKEKSMFCETSEKQNLSENEFEDLNLDCRCTEYGKRECLEGWELKGNYCWKENLYTNPLRACRYYECEKNYYAEVFEEE